MTGNTGAPPALRALEALNPIAVLAPGDHAATIIHPFDTGVTAPLAPPVPEAVTLAAVLPPALPDLPPLGAAPARVKNWFDTAVQAVIPAHDGTLETARLAADAYARHAKADNTRRAYRAGVRAWCAWCHQHALPCLPARAADVVAFLAAERGRGLSVTTIELRLAAVQVEHLEPRERGLRLTLPRSKGERAGRAVTVAIPFGRTELCPVRAVRRWQEAAGIVDGALFRRIWEARLVGDGPLPSPRVGTAAIDPGTVARIVKKRAAAAGFDRDLLAGHSLKRGALTTGMDQGVHPTRLKQLGRHKSYAVLDEYLQFGDPFDGHPLADVL